MPYWSTGEGPGKTVPSSPPGSGLGAGLTTLHCKKKNFAETLRPPCASEGIQGANEEDVSGNTKNKEKLPFLTPRHP